LRRFIDRTVGGIDKLMVPADDADLPQPRLADGSPDPQFETTEAKRYLGKLLFHDPARATRIIPEFGGVTPNRRYSPIAAWLSDVEAPRGALAATKCGRIDSIRATPMS
jgi:hypothetical protein